MSPAHVPKCSESLNSFEFELELLEWPMTQCSQPDCSDELVAFIHLSVYSAMHRTKCPSQSTTLSPIIVNGGL